MDGARATQRHAAAELRAREPEIDAERLAVDVEVDHVRLRLSLILQGTMGVSYGVRIFMPLFGSRQHRRLPLLRDQTVGRRYRRGSSDEPPIDLLVGTLEAAYAHGRSRTPPQLDGDE